VCVKDGSISCIGKLGSRADGYTVLLAGDGSSGAPFAPKPLLQAFADVLTRSSTPLKLAALRAITSLISYVCHSLARKVPCMCVCGLTEIPNVCVCVCVCVCVSIDCAASSRAMALRHRRRRRCTI